ncbi:MULTISPECIES: polysaccharide biosynthesis/export family protein [Chryseobacterium]|uniref:Polysaccharide export outer membrane protein n=2 Tax=Chryseobacterium TaxID=59732 RepID=A0ABU0TDF0_9FLAO|nr:MULTISPECIES: polysaccharide biosynthesis/export family protein [Chryseobacterium]MDQ1095107.1 polysaccharide export outer membrane protein [Chryseobacterium camelliae]MDR6086394.1 polysaccharide export outer membrane protein [Chryseobacterium sp. SORGH_AS_0909]MDR6130766.1 polysaccharide export outer membrane protein [Chryseobacterium sp. SORGH_AS_1175]MDT3407101.1 polysaccharide export outer membrane protein [Pseudacidovorax intermedius]
MKNLSEMSWKNFICGCALSILLFSCGARQEINYMKDIENVALDNSIKNSRTTLQPGDQLIITVSAKDMDVVKPFNQVYSSASTITQYSQPSSNNLPQQIPVSGPTYSVDTDYNITFPQIGKISVKDENIETLKTKLTSLLREYIKDPIVDAKLINFRVSVLGEVARPGTYVLPDGNATLLSALGLAGDLTTYGVRTNVLVVRNVDGVFTKERINLTSAQFINSPYYYLKQNDIIYVQPNANREKAARVDPNTGLYISVASVIASLVIGVLALTKN